MKFTPKFLLSLIVLYVVSLGISFASFTYIIPTDSDGLTSPSAGSQDVDKSALIVVDPGAPKTEVCPLNGALFTKAEREAWEKRRPLMVMIENHLEARPQSGLSKADIVYEAMAEGGITRFMAGFYCNAITHDLAVGPVRSARTYFLDWASEYSKNPLYVHVGGANTPNKANALGQIEEYGWAVQNDLNQFALTVKECKRDDSLLKKYNGGVHVATEHTMYCSTEALWKVAEKRGWTAVDKKGDSWTKTFTPWKFADPKSVDSPTTTPISFEFWDGFAQYAVSWTYDSVSNMYARANGGAPHVDALTGQPISSRVIIAQFVKETGPIDDHKHMLYGTTGTGKAIVFQNGEAIKANWSKKDRLSRTIFTDEKGKEISFARGQIWVEELPTGTTVTY